MRTCVLLMLSVFGLCPPQESCAFEETIDVPSRALTEEQFLRGAVSSAPEIRLRSTLSGPDVDRKLPSVILLHGGDGPGSGATWGWSRYLNSIGVAALSLDSYTARNLTNISADQGTFPQFIQVYDAYRAVEVLASHEKIDPSLIMVMGYSRGGTAALYAAMSRFHQAFGPATGRIAAYFPFYPLCNFRLEGEENLVPAPIRQFHGSADDWTPLGLCEDYFKRLTGAGHDATITALPGALHAFDNPRNPAHYADANWQTSRNCMRVENDGRLENAATGKPFAYTDACVEYGPSVKYDDKANATAQQAVKGIIEGLTAGR
jgi:dienelactone hydrolase